MIVQPQMGTRRLMRRRLTVFRFVSLCRVFTSIPWPLRLWAQILRSFDPETLRLFVLCTNIAHPSWTVSITMRYGDQRYTPHSRLGWNRKGDGAGTRGLDKLVVGPEGGPGGGGGGGALPYAPQFLKHNRGTDWSRHGSHRK